jgi:glycosyltransferase involved in cell wall biosynthesis
MMKVLVDATALRVKPSGIGLYIQNLLSGLEKLQARENFQLLVSYQPSMKNWLRGNLSTPKQLRQYNNLHCLPIPVTISSLLAKYPNPLLTYFEKYLGSPDIMHGPDHVVYPCSNSLKVMTITDLTFLKFPDYVNTIVQTYTERIKQCLQWTDLIITISESSKGDIVNYLGVNPEKIRVTYLASRYAQTDFPDDDLEQLKGETNYDFSIPYLLFVSTIEPRKNVTNLIAAFNLLKEKYKLEHRLVLIGQKGWKYRPIFAAIDNSPWRGDIYHLDYLSDAQVALFYRQAALFVYPSIYEGFGLPVLEAMTLGTPVVTSETSSLPEVVGDAALMIDPFDTEAIAGAIWKVIADSQLRQDLIEQGREQARRFSWQKTAQDTLNAYRSFF